MATTKRVKKPKTISGAANLARELGVSRVTVSEWIVRGMPLLTRGSAGEAHTFNLAACKAWLNSQGLQQDTDLESPKNRAEADLALVLQKIRKERANADKAELALQVRRGQLLEAADVSSSWSAHMLAAKAVLQQLAPKLAALLVGRTAREIEQLLGSEADTALAALGANPT